MCSLNDDYDGQQLMQVEEIDHVDAAICRKCKEHKAEVTLRKTDVYCNVCFLSHATHKFRAALGKSKIVKPTDTILVGHNGHAGSTALLHLIKSGMNASVRKRLMFAIKVLHVDDRLVTGETDNTSKIMKIVDQMDQLGFESYGVALSEVLNVSPSPHPLKDRPPPPDTDQKLLEIFAKIPDETSRKDFHQKLVKKLMISVAKIFGCEKIFLADDSTSLAVDILTNVSIGRGAQLVHECGFVDDRIQDVMVLRPMREFSRLEVYEYLRTSNIDFLEDESPEKNSKENSIQKLTDKFVKSLEEQFNGTVSTIFRTGEKIYASRESQKKGSSDFCVFCNGCMDTSTLDFTSSIEATNFSRLVSSKGSSAEIDLEKLIGREVEEENSGKTCKDCKCGKQQEVAYEDVKDYLCYSCRIILPSDNFNAQNLPNFVKKNALERMRMKSMEEEIQDFLL